MTNQNKENFYQEKIRIKSKNKKTVFLKFRKKQVTKVQLVLVLNTFGWEGVGNFLDQS